MGNATSKELLIRHNLSNHSDHFQHFTIDLYSVDSTHQILKTYCINQKLSDILKHPTSTLFSTAPLLLLDTDLPEDETEFYASLIDRQETSTAARVGVAQCKMYGFGTSQDIEEGARLLHQLCDHPESWYPLGCYYFDQKRDYAQAYHYFRLLRKQDGLAQYRLGLMMLYGQGITQNLQGGFHYLKLAAKNNNKYAQFILGFYYEHGILVRCSTSVAKDWYERSANQGFAEAQTHLANLLLITHPLLTTTSAAATAQEKEIMMSLLKDQVETIKLEALTWLEKATDQENANALIRLGALYEEGVLVPKDTTKAFECYKRATQAPFTSKNIKALAHYLVGIHYRSAEQHNDHILALEHLSLSAESGYAPAQRILGIMYLEGTGVSRDDVKAHQLFQAAAAQGDVRSLGFLADHQRSALSLYERAAKAGSLNAQLALAELLQHVGQHALAFKWFKTASKNTPQHDNLMDVHVGWSVQRNTARLMVARYQYNGWDGVKLDRARALEEFQLLSKSGFPDAHYWLAACYEEGVMMGERWLVQPDATLAFDVYRQSAEAGDRDGQFQVAYMMSNGVGGIERDVEGAFEWYLKAAEQGHRTAQYSLGLYFEYGLVDVDVDLETAKGWYTLAAHELSTAMVRLALVLVKLDNRSVPEAVEWLKRAIEKDDVVALRELANMYKDDLVDDENVSVTEPPDSLDHLRVAFGYYKSAADKGDALSWHALSKFFEGAYDIDDEIVVPTDFEKAVECLKKAQKLGHEVAILDLADLYYRHDRVDETMKIYDELATSLSDSIPYIANKAKVEAAKIVVFENYGEEADQHHVYNWLTEMISYIEDSRQQGGSESGRILAEAYELLGYCFEHGIGTNVNQQKATEFYLKCVHEEEDGKNDKVEEDEEPSWAERQRNHEHWAKQRSLCRLVYTFMEEKEYQSAFTYLQALKPDLDEMSELPSYDAQYQARRMKYNMGFLLFHGLGVKKSVQESLFWLGDASDEGDGDAAYLLGCFLAQLHEDGLDSEVRQRFQQGVLVNHAGCMRELALILLSDEEGGLVGILAEDDEKKQNDKGAPHEILELLESASQLDDLESTYQLGRLYENGFSHVIPEKNIDKALEYYTLAASRDHEPSMLKTGEILGSIAINQHEQAIEWFQKAKAMYDNTKAKVMLISYQFQGFFAPENDEMNDKDERSFKLLQELVNKEVTILETEVSFEIEEEDLVKRRMQKEQLTMKKEGLGLALYILGQCYELGKGTAINLTTAKSCYYRSINVSRHIDSMWRLGIIYNELENDDSSALEWFRKAVEKGKHRESHYQLGLFHLNGRGGLESNIAVAKKHFSKAAEQGHPLATFELARIIWNIDHDHLYAYELYKVAGQQLHVPGALRELGHLSHTGFTMRDIQIIEQDRKQAFAYYGEAAKLGDAIGALMVGTYFEKGYLKEELGQDLDRALQWYESAYKLNCGSLSELAIGKLKHLMAESMTDVKQAEDMREEALVWLESAANDESSSSHIMTAAKVMIALYCINGWGRKTLDPKQGFQILLEIINHTDNLEAIIAIAKCYEEGVGAEYDMMKAKTYWEMAAERNSREALIRLGDIYELGLTGTINRKIANEYYDKAKLMELKAKQGDHRIS